MDLLFFLFPKKEFPIKNNIFGKTNLIVLGIGAVTLLIGYFCLSRGPEDNPLSLSVAPILLVLGYCVLLPISIILKGKNTDNKPGD